MVRFALVVAACLWAFDTATVSAQGYGYPYSFPIYGSGYAYDPYERGSFRAPDLHDDPLFRAQHKFDSHFPGRYARPESLQLRHAPFPTVRPTRSPRPMLRFFQAW